MDLFQSFAQTRLVRFFGGCDIIRCFDTDCVLGTLTKNEQTVTEAYAVDETIFLDPNSTIPYVGTVSPAIKKALDIGALCNNASLVRNEDGAYVGQSTDVALLNVLQLFGVPDRREVRSVSDLHHPLSSTPFFIITDVPSFG